MAKFFVNSRNRFSIKVLRYAEVFARSDGSFSLSNIAPGKYWLIARAAPDDEMSDIQPAPVAWDANERAKLRREAERSKTEVELKPCQRVADQTIKWTMEVYKFWLKNRIEIR